MNGLVGWGCHCVNNKPVMKLFEFEAILCFSFMWDGECVVDAASGSKHTEQHFIFHILFHFLKQTFSRNVDSDDTM